MKSSIFALVGVFGIVMFVSAVFSIKTNQAVDFGIEVLLFVGLALMYGGLIVYSLTAPIRKESST